MTDLIELSANIAAATDRESWIVAMDHAGEEEGYFQRAGKRHWAYFADHAPTLLVGFETVDEARARPGQRPLVQDLAAAQGWSHLTLLADGATFWRDAGVWSFMDRLVDDAFFEDFDRALFYGAGAGGYAAAAFSVVAPGAQVLLAAPRATMDPGLAGWDRRDRAARRLDFTSRYGYAPDMTEGAARVHLLFDPLEREDAMHAALFRAPHVTRHALPRAGANPESTLTRLGVLAGLVQAAAEGRLNGAEIARAWRKRRTDVTYLKATLAQIAESGKPGREIKLCRAVLRHTKVPRMARRLAELEGRKS